MYVMRRKGNWEYVAEGVVHDSCNWEQIISKHQTSNGSLFNSPATTAAAAIHSHDHNCFEYLVSILKHNDGWGTEINYNDVFTSLYPIYRLVFVFFVFHMIN